LKLAFATQRRMLHHCRHRAHPTTRAPVACLGGTPADERDTPPTTRSTSRVPIAYPRHHRTSNERTGRGDHEGNPWQKHTTSMPHRTSWAPIAYPRRRRRADENTGASNTWDTHVITHPGSPSRIQGHHSMCDEHTWRVAPCRGPSPTEITNAAQRRSLYKQPAKPPFAHPGRGGRCNSHVAPTRKQKLIWTVDPNGHELGDLEITCARNTQDAATDNTNALEAWSHPLVGSLPAQLIGP